MIFRTPRSAAALLLPLLICATAAPAVARSSAPVSTQVIAPCHGTESVDNNGEYMSGRPGAFAAGVPGRAAGFVACTPKTPRHGRLSWLSRSIHGTASVRVSPYRGELVASAFDHEHTTFVLFDRLTGVDQQRNTLYLGRYDDAAHSFSTPRPLSNVTDDTFSYAGALAADDAHWWAVWNRPDNSLVQSRTIGADITRQTLPNQHGGSVSLAYEDGRAVLLTASARLVQLSYASSLGTWGRPRTLHTVRAADKYTGRAGDVALVDGKTYATWRGDIQHCAGAPVCFGDAYYADDTSGSLVTTELTDLYDQGIGRLFLAVRGAQVWVGALGGSQRTISRLLRVVTRTTTGAWERVYDGAGINGFGRPEQVPLGLQLTSTGLSLLVIHFRSRDALGEIYARSF